MPPHALPTFSLIYFPAHNPEPEPVRATASMYMEQLELASVTHQQSVVERPSAGLGALTSQPGSPQPRPQGLPGVTA